MSKGVNEMDITTLMASLALAKKNTDDAIISALDDTIKIVEYTASYTLGANSSKALTVTDFSVSNPTGYTPIGIVAYSTGDQYSFAYQIISNNINADDRIMSIHNVSNASVSSTASINILYIKDSYV